MSPHKVYQLIAFVAVTAVIMAGCGGGGEASPTAAPAQDKPAPTAEAQDQAVEPEAETESEPAQEAGESSGDTRDIADLDANLDALKSYRALLSYSFEGKDDKGGEVKSSLEFLYEAINETKDMHMRMTGSGAGTGVTGSDQGALEFFRVGGVSYIYNEKNEGDQKCVSFATEDDKDTPSGMFKPSDVVGGLDNAKLAERGVTVNGIVADHYTFDEKALSFGLFADASGDAWVASDGNYLVKYIGKATGKAGILSKNASEGTVSWEYNLEQVNALDKIELPAECEASKPAGDIPIPPDATEKAQFGGMLTFKTADEPSKVAEFYTAEMLKQGWEEGEASEMGDMQTLNFTKDDRQLTIMITKDDEGTTVIITETKKEG